MNNNVKLILTFTLGVAAGSVATWKFFKTKYAAIAQEEIDSVKEVYAKKREREEEKPKESLFTREEIDAYENAVTDLGYINNEKGGSDIMKNDGIEVIPPDEFGDIDDYERASLIYYADGILTDDRNEVIDDIENFVGDEALDSFGEWEEDSVFVKNDNLECYYEILKDYRKFSDLKVDE